MSIEVCKQTILDWVHNLENEKKCSVIKTVSKNIQGLDEDDQKEIITFLARELQERLKIKNGDLLHATKACHVLNGCFDNFPVAAKAVQTIFQEVIVSLADYLDLCWKCYSGSESLNCSNPELAGLTLRISRLGTLVLKLRRLKAEKKATPCTKELKNVFQRMSITTSLFICEEDNFSNDIKINLAMVLWLMREVAASSVEELIKLHDNFTKTLPTCTDKDLYDAVVKSIMAAGALNVWEQPIITPPQTALYLTLFLSICETCSSDTPVLLMVCRALQVLAAHEVFILYDITDVEAGRLVACVLMLLEHSVSCVRHSGRDLVEVVIRKPRIQKFFLEAVLALSHDRKSFFIGLGSLAIVMDTRQLINHSVKIPSVVMAAVQDPTIISHVVFAIEQLAVHDSLKNTNSQEWCDLWVMPLLHALSHCVSMVAADVEKLLQILFITETTGIEYVMEKWKNPDTDEKLRGILACLRIRNKMKGDACKMVHLISDEIDSSNVLKLCMSHGHDDIRLSAFALIAEGSMTNLADLDLPLYFLKYNLNNHQPATRQKVLALFGKLLTRVNLCYLQFIKPSNTRQVETKPEDYVKFLTDIIKFCYGNIFAGANFNRLSTVLSILGMCQKILDHTLQQLVGLYDPQYWGSLFLALASTYEENKVLAVQLMKGFPFDNLEINVPEVLRLKFRQTFGLIQKLEPPTVLLGSYQLCVLLAMPSAAYVLKTYFADLIENVASNPHVLCVQILTRYLSIQLEEASESYVKGARDSPMYGTLFAIRLILKQLDLEALMLGQTKVVIQNLVDLSLNIANVVSAVVNNSSPEGHLPMDFQAVVDEYADEEIENAGNKTLEHLKDVKSMMAAYKVATSPEEKILLAERIRDALETELEQKLAHDAYMPLYDPSVGKWSADVLETRKLLAEYDCYYKFFEGHLPRIIRERPVTAQALLLYSWRSMKEACLYLGDLVSKLPLKDAVEHGLLNENLIIRIGRELRRFLSEIKHRGAFEQADVGFTKLCQALWSCPIPSLQMLPSLWLEEVLKEITLPAADQSLKFTSMRRSAGLPFLVQAIISSQISSNYTNYPRCLQETMETLLVVAADAQSNNVEPRLHALNILRSLFKHAMLGEFVTSYVCKALQVAILGSKSPLWPVRNCCNMLFSVLVTRIFGVARSRDHLSKKNKMTSRYNKFFSVFFRRFPDLLALFHKELTDLTDGSRGSGGHCTVSPQPSLYLVLLLLGRLYPPTNQVSDISELDLDVFVHLMAQCAGNPILRIRVLAAKALVPFLSPDRIPSELSWRLLELNKQNGVSSNLQHGLLLQVVELLEELRKYPRYMNLVSKMPFPTWMFDVFVNSADAMKTVPFSVLEALVNVGTILYRYYLDCNTFPQALATAHLDWTFLTFFAKRRDPGADAFLASLLAFQLEALGQASDWQGVFRRLVQLKDCGLEAVENLLLQFIYCSFTPPHERDSNYDFSLVEGMVERIVSSHTEGGFRVNEFDWKEYIKSEMMAIPRSSNIQQRRLRTLILGRLVLLKFRKLSSEARSSLIFELLWLYTSFWESDALPRISEAADDNLTLTEPMYGRLVVAMETLIDGDRQCRLALVTILQNGCWTLLPQSIGENTSLGFYFRKYWLNLFFLLVDEDEDVRKAAQSLVPILSVNINHDLPYTNNRELVTPLAAQEAALRCFTFIIKGQGNLCGDLMLMALLTVVQGGEESAENDPLEIFKRGNPNPFNEIAALTKLFIDAAFSLPSNGALNLPFPGGTNTATLLHIELSPHFARYGLRLKNFSTPRELLQELGRLEAPDNAENDVFWCQVQQVLRLVAIC